MKRTLLLMALAGIIITAQAQENAFTISGGYAYANLEDSETNSNGWRINGLYEFVPMGGKLAHGISLGYISTIAEEGDGVLETYKLINMPIYYAPKYSFGKNNLNVFIKGAFGMHYSWYERDGTILLVKDSDFGFYGGAGAGIKYTIKEKFFLQAEYEWAYLSNALYMGGFMNSAMGGIGIMF